MEKKKNPKGPYVFAEDCEAKHTKLDLALFGLDGRAGMVKDISDIKSDLRIIKENVKGKLSGRDKAVIIGAIITALTSLIASVLALLKG